MREVCFYRSAIFTNVAFPPFSGDKEKGGFIDVVPVLVRGLKFLVICILQFPRESTIADTSAASSSRGDIYIFVSLFSCKLLHSRATNVGPRRSARSDSITSRRNFCQKVEGDPR